MSSHNDTVTIDPSAVHLAKGSAWRALPIIGLVLAAAGLGGAFALRGDHHHEFWYAYLVAWYGFLAIGLGGLFFVIIQHLVRAGWSIAVRRLAENVAITLPILCLVGLPIVLFGMHDLYHWTDTAAVDADFMLSAKKGYLNEGFFKIRIGVYFAIWTLLSVLFYRWSTTGDDDAEKAARNADKARGFAAPALFLFALSLTFAAFDFLMSLDPHWFSTIYGVLVIVGQGLSTLAFQIIILTWLARRKPMSEALTTTYLHDLANLMFGFTVLWAYLSFSQYLIIWSGNLPEETSWYLERSHGGWKQPSSAAGAV